LAFYLTGNIDLPVSENTTSSGMEDKLDNLLTMQIEKLSQLEKANSFLLEKLNNEDIDDLVTIIMERKSLDQEIQNLDNQIKIILSRLNKNNSGILKNNTLHLQTLVQNKASEVKRSLSLLNDLTQKIQGSFLIKLTGLLKQNKAAESYVTSNTKRTRYDING